MAQHFHTHALPPTTLQHRDVAVGGLYAVPSAARWSRSETPLTASTSPAHSLGYSETPDDEVTAATMRCFAGGQSAGGRTGVFSPTRPGTRDGTPVMAASGPMAPGGGKGSGGWASPPPREVMCGTGAATPMRPSFSSSHSPGFPHTTAAAVAAAGPLSSRRSILSTDGDAFETYVGENIADVLEMDGGSGGGGGDDGGDEVVGITAEGNLVYRRRRQRTTAVEEGPCTAEDLGELDARGRANGPAESPAAAAAAAAGGVVVQELHAVSPAPPSPPPPRLQRANRLGAREEHVQHWRAPDPALLAPSPTAAAQRFALQMRMRNRENDLGCYFLRSQLREATERCQAEERQKAITVLQSINPRELPR